MPPPFYCKPLLIKVEEDRLDTALPPQLKSNLRNNQSKKCLSIA